MPRLRAVVTAAVRSVTPSLSKMWSMCALTVESLMWSSRAISLLLRPCATSMRISISLSLTCESASPRNLSTRREATPGARGDLPPAASRMASKSLSSRSSFSRNPVAPFSKARRMSASVS